MLSTILESLQLAILGTTPSGKKKLLDWILMHNTRMTHPAKISQTLQSIETESDRSTEAEFRL